MHQFLQRLHLLITSSSPSLFHLIIVLIKHLSSVLLIDFNIVVKLLELL